MAYINRLLINILFSWQFNWHTHQYLASSALTVANCIICLHKGLWYYMKRKIFEITNGKWVF